MSAVRDAFRKGRVEATKHIAACETVGFSWGEACITEIVTSRAAAAVAVVPFTQRAESLSGADWIWWWMDHASSYGMLVQAKRLRISSSRWRFDFEYRTRGAPNDQRHVLRETARILNLSPTYALYLGTADYRRWHPCSTRHTSQNCFECRTRAISLMPALLADSHVIRDADSTYENSVALENLWTPDASTSPLIPPLRAQVSSDLTDFLSTPQEGSRAVTRKMIDRVLTARSKQFSAPTPTMEGSKGLHDRLGPVFPELPDDTGHWSVNYFQQVLDPLRLAPPDYVLEVASGDFDVENLAGQFPDNVAGIIVVRPPGLEDS